MQLDCIIDLKSSRKRAKKEVELLPDLVYFEHSNSQHRDLSETTSSLPDNAAAIPVCATVEEHESLLHLDEYEKSAMVVGDGNDIFIFDDNVSIRTGDLKSMTKAINPTHQAFLSSTIYQQTYSNFGDSSKILSDSSPDESSYAQILHCSSKHMTATNMGELRARDRIDMGNDSEVEVEAEVDSSFLRNKAFLVNTDSDNDRSSSSCGIGTPMCRAPCMTERTNDHIPSFAITSIEGFPQPTCHNIVMSDVDGAHTLFPCQRYEDVVKERKKKKSSSDSSDRMSSTTGEKKPRIGPTGREIFVFDEAAVRVFNHRKSSLFLEFLFSCFNLNNLHVPISFEFIYSYNYS